jgi:hypothetical protein
MLGIGLPVGAAGPYRSVDPDAAAYAAAMTVAPSAARVALFDALVRALKAGGLWSRLDLFYLLAAHHEQAGRVNLVALGINTCAAVNSPNFLDDRGFAGDGATSYLSTGLNPSLGSTGFALNDATLFAWSLTDLNTSAGDIGSGAATRLLGRSGGSLAARANAGTTTSVTVADSLGLYGWTRNAAGGHDFFRGGGSAGEPRAGEWVDQQRRDPDRRGGLHLFVPPHRRRRGRPGARCRPHRGAGGRLRELPRSGGSGGMSEATYIEMTAPQAEAVRGETCAGHRLEPVALAGGTFVLPVAVLDDPAHAVRRAALAALPARAVAAEEWVGE